MRRSRIRSMRCWRTAGGKLSQMSIWGISVENHTPKPIAQTLHFRWIGRGSKAARKIEELLLLSLLSLDAFLNEFDHHPIRADTPRLCHAADLRCETRRQANALAHFFIRCPHGTIMHQIGAACLIISQARITCSRVVPIFPIARCSVNLPCNTVCERKNSPVAFTVSSRRRFSWSVPL